MDPTRQACRALPTNSRTTERGDVAVFVAVDAYFFEGEQEFAVREAEHAEGFLVADAVGDGLAGGGFEVGNGEREFFVEGHDFDSFGG